MSFNLQKRLLLNSIFGAFVEVLREIKSGICYEYSLITRTIPKHNLRVTRVTSCVYLTFTFRRILPFFNHSHGLSNEKYVNFDMS